jgi:uncharacterized repeat protein (TIGR01451 family)
MKGFRFLPLYMLPALALLVGGAQAGAQGIGFSVTTTTDVMTTNDSLTYTINVTNQTGLPVQDISVTNAFSGPVSWGANFSQGVILTNAAGPVFDLGRLADGTFAQILLTIQPAAIGFLTNAITVATNSVNAAVATNVVIQVITAQADLGVTLTGFAQTTNFVNDFMTYAVTVTNSGPDGAPAVILSNNLPAGVELIGVSPANQAYTLFSNILVFSLGTMTNGGFDNFQVTVEPTNAGALPYSSSVSATGLLDTNAANNLASNIVIVENFLSTNLVVTNVSAMSYDPQTGLMNQILRLSNIGANDVPSARVIVSGLTNSLFNAVGTNDGNPYVVYASELDTNQSVNLTLKYFVPTRLPIAVADSNYTAVGVSKPDWSAPVATATSTNLNITSILPLTNGCVLIEFPSTAGRAYTVVYSDNAAFSNAIIAPPAVVAPADRTQWIDYGPPTTVSAPTNAASRFYRVFQNP